MSISHKRWAEKRQTIPFREPYRFDYNEYLSKCLTFLCDNKNISILKEDGSSAAYIVHQHKLHPDGVHFYLFANSSRSIGYENVSIILNYEARGIKYWDTLTGEIKDFFHYKVEKGNDVLIFPVQSFSVIPFKRNIKRE